ncbi:MAG: recombinase RecT [Dehalococcoidia bacterium]|jgi:hypothetical protein
MAGNPIDASELERAVNSLDLPVAKVSAELYDVTLPDGSRATVGLKAGQIDCPRNKDLKEKVTMLICDIRAGLVQSPLVAEESTKIMALMKQVPGYMPEISIEMIANLVHCPNATAEDLMMLAVTAKNIGANPFLPGEIFLIKPKQRDDGGQPPAYTVIGQTLIAKKLFEVPGFEKAIRGIIVESKEGVVSYKEGKYYNPKREELVGGWSEIHYNDGRERVRSEIALCEVIGTSANWKKMPATMVAKCAFMDAGRTAEPKLLGNCYDIDEMGGSLKMDPDKEISS